MSIHISLPEALHDEMLVVSQRQDAVAAISELVRRELERKRRQHRLTIERFERAYGMTFEEFDRTRAVPAMAFETERDYFDWDLAVSAMVEIDRETFV